MTPSDLVSIEEIKILKARYFRYLDLKRWDDLLQLFTEDAQLNFREIREQPYRREDAIDMICDVLTDCVTIHHGHMPEIELLTPQTARGVWAMQDILYWNSRGQEKIGRASTYGWGHYYETYRREGSTWLIHYLRLDRLAVQSQTPIIRFGYDENSEWAP